MLGEVHLNLVLWKTPPCAMKALYRQIAVVEQEQFQGSKCVFSRDG
jgi:hypothetical protein